jgi:hypothetical protein
VRGSSRVIRRATGLFVVPNRVLTVSTLTCALWRCRGCRLIGATATTSQPVINTHHFEAMTGRHTRILNQPDDKRPRSFLDAHCRGRACPDRDVELFRPSRIERNEALF